MICIFRMCKLMWCLLKQTYQKICMVGLFCMKDKKHCVIIRSAKNEAVQKGGLLFYGF